MTEELRNLYNLHARARRTPKDHRIWGYLFEFCRTVDLEVAKPLVKEIQRQANRMAREMVTAGWLELYRKATLFQGAYEFDSYMLACEARREPRARFWVPRRKVLEGRHKIATRIQNFIDDQDSTYLGFSMPPGTGKSTLIKFLLAFIAGQFPESANMYVSYADGMVKTLFDSVKDILTNTGEYAHNDIFPSSKSIQTSAEYNTVSYKKRGEFPTLSLVAL